MAFDKASLSGYVEVKDRIVSFLKDHPGGVFQSEVIFHKDWHGEYWAWREKKVKVGRCGLICVKGRVFRSPDDKLPAEGHSWMQTPGVTPYTEGSEVENAETSAWGRALATMGYGITKSLASIDEIRNKSHDDRDDFLSADVASEGRAPGTKVPEVASSTPAVGSDTAPAALITPEQCGMVFEQFATFYNAAGHSKMSDEAIQKFGPVETWQAADFDARFAKIKKAVAKVVPDEDIKF